MEITERQNSIWNYLRSDSEVADADLRFVTRVATGTEEVEFI